jgi:hypothetical protein
MHHAVRNGKVLTILFGKYKLPTNDFDVRTSQRFQAEAQHHSDARVHAARIPGAAERAAGADAHGLCQVGASSLHRMACGRLPLVPGSPWQHAHADSACRNFMSGILPQHMQDRSSEAAATPSAKGAMKSTAKNVVCEKILKDCISTLSRKQPLCFDKFD